MGVSLIGGACTWGLGQGVQQSGGEQGVPVVLGREVIDLAVQFGGQRCGGR